MATKRWVGWAVLALIGCGGGSSQAPAPDASADVQVQDLAVAGDAGPGSPDGQDVAPSDTAPSDAAPSDAATADAAPSDAAADVVDADAAVDFGPDTPCTDTVACEPCPGAKASGPCGCADNYAPAGTCKPLCPGPQPPDTECVDGQWQCKAGLFANLDGQCEAFSCPGVAKVHDAKIAALVQASNSCSQSSDCLYVLTDTGCKGACGAVIHKDQQDKFAQTLQAIDLQYCATLSYALKCGYMTPGCIAPTPACENGKCVWSPTVANCPGDKPKDAVCVDGQWVCPTGFVLVAGACEPANCESISQQLQTEVEQLVTGMNACQDDLDCVVVPSGTACQGTCGVAIHQGKKADFAQALASLDQVLCKDTNFAQKCGYSTPKCLAPAPGCVAGACVYKK